MSEESIFNADPVITEPVVINPANITTTLPPEVAEFVGEGKKYKTTEDALKALPHAQAHIKKLEEEAAQIREELIKRKTTEELLEEIKAQSTVVPVVTPQPVAQTTPASVTNIDIAKTVDAVIAQREAQQVAKNNAARVVEAFRASFGESSEAKYTALAEETGIPIAELNRLAARSPTAVLKLAGIAEAKQESSSHRSGSSVNTQAVLQNQSPQGTPSARVAGGTTRELVSAWKAAKPT